MFVGKVQSLSLSLVRPSANTRATVDTSFLRYIHVYATVLGPFEG